VLAVPAVRQHFARQVAKGFCRKLSSVKSRSNQPVDVDGICLVAGFIGRLEIVTTSNYSPVPNSHILQFIAERTKPSQVSCSIRAW
jgi:hypothetical protein